MIKLLLVLILSLGGMACNKPPLAPSPVEQHFFDYTINVPDTGTTQHLKMAYPNGAIMSPARAQIKFNFVSAYHGSANVYAGEQMPSEKVYVNAGILICPLSVSEMDTFTAKDWPTIGGLENGLTYTWRGWFTYTPFDAKYWNYNY